jgi:glycerol kinase
MSDFKDRLPKALGSLKESTIARGEANIAGIQRKQYEKAFRDAEKRAVSLRLKAEKTEGRLVRTRLEEAALQADQAAEAMRKKIAELG